MPGPYSRLLGPARMADVRVGDHGTALGWGRTSEGRSRPRTTGDLDVWMFTSGARSGGAAAVAWVGPVNLLSLNTPGKEGPRPLGQHDLVMPFASDRDSPAMYRTYLVQRPSAAAPFGAPKLVSELVFAERSTVDAFLTEDGLTLFFCSAPLDGPGDLYVAWRRSLSQPFEVYVPIDGLNTAGDDRDPWLSRDGKLLFFSSDRDGAGQLGIYSARVTPNPL